MLYFFGGQFFTMRELLPTKIIGTTKMWLISGLVLVSVISVGTYYVVYKWLPKKTEQEFNDLIQSLVTSEDLVNWLVNKLEVPKNQVETALIQWMDGGKQDPIITSVLRIECGITRMKRKCLVKIAIAVKGEDGVVMGEKECEINWEDLPQDIRRNFIRSGKPTQVFILASN
jgi:hypothetical protein